MADKFSIIINDEAILPPETKRTGFSARNVNAGLIAVAITVYIKRSKLLINAWQVAIVAVILSNGLRAAIKQAHVVTSPAVDGLFRIAGNPPRSGSPLA